MNEQLINGGDQWAWSTWLKAPVSEHHLCLMSDELPHNLMLTAGRPEHDLTRAPRRLPKVHRRTVSCRRGFRGALLFIKFQTIADLPHCFSQLSFPAWKVGTVLPTLAFLPASKAGVNLKPSSTSLTESQESVKAQGHARWWWLWKCCSLPIAT